MRRDAEVTKWQAKVVELEQQMVASPAPKLAEMLSDARNALRFVTTRQKDMSKH